MTPTELRKAYRIARSIATSLYRPRRSGSLEVEDLQQVGVLHLWRRRDRPRPDGVSWSAWAGSTIRFGMLETLRYLDHEEMATKARPHRFQAEAAREVKALISASVENVEAGTALVDRAGQTMQEIVQSVQRVTDMIGEITAAATEQSAGVSQVNQAVGNLDQMTQQNAALVEESAAAAESLREQADRMKQAVAVFKMAA